MKKTIRILALVLAISILACSLAFTASAEADGDADRAAAFILAVNSISEKTTLSEREIAIAAARSEGVYFDDESYDGVTEALKLLAEYEAIIEAEIGRCLEFCDIVDAASSLDVIEDYLELKALLEEAKGYLNIVDKTYIGVSGAVGIYGNLTSELLKKEQRVATFLEQVARMSAATVYSEKYDAYREAKMICSAKDFLNTHPDVIAAKADFDAASDYFGDCAFVAAMFAEQVDKIYDAEILGEAINDAYEIYVNMDKTYPSDFISEFNNIVDDYNEAATKINSLFG